MTGRCVQVPNAPDPCTKPPPELCPRHRGNPLLGLRPGELRLAQEWSEPVDARSMAGAWALRRKPLPARFKRAPLLQRFAERTRLPRHTDALMAFAC